MIAAASANVAIWTPSTETRRSPGWIPAAWAGVTPPTQSSEAIVAGVHSLSDETVAVAVCTPKPDIRMVMSTIASRRFMTGPPSMITTRLPIGSDENRRCGCAPTMVSRFASRASCTMVANSRVRPGREPSSGSAYIPAIEMYPPSGSAFTPYSVSPRRQDAMVGPNPIMYCPTRTPKAFAGSR